jgi:hypothetical protein
MNIDNLPDELIDYYIALAIGWELQTETSADGVEVSWWSENDMFMEWENQFAPTRYCWQANSIANKFNLEKEPNSGHPRRALMIQLLKRTYPDGIPSEIEI